MARYSQQFIEEQYQKLPEDLKQAIYSEDIALKLFELGRKYGITIEKNGFLAEEVGYLMLGLSRPEDFPKYVKERLDFNDEETVEVVKDINQLILYPLRQALKRAHQMEIKEEVSVVPPPPPPRPIELPSKTIVMQEKFEPITPPPPPKPPPSPLATAGKAKIPPIDLRQGAKPRPTPPEIIRGVIFAPPAKKPAEPSAAPKPNLPETPEPKTPEPKPPEKKPTARVFDPYREPIE